MTFVDAKMYESENKIKTIPIIDSNQNIYINSNAFNTSTNHSKSNNKNQVKSASTPKFILAILVLGIMVTAFSIVMNNFTLNPIDTLDEIPGPILDKHARYSMFPNPECDKCKELYPDAQEFIPDKSGTPLLKGWPVRMTVIKNADHGHEKSALLLGKTIV